MLVLQWEYLLGSAVASQWNDRQSPEWPPHPDRVFQALVAAWGGTGCQQGGAAALRWLESQPAPGMCVEHISPADTRIRKEHLSYVPVNDTEGKDIGILPSERAKKPRCFPTIAVDGVTALVWPDAQCDKAVFDALQELCVNVTNIGHSSSLVRVWLSDSLDMPMTFVPDQNGSEVMRVPFAGRFDILVDAYSEGGENWKRPPVAKCQRYAWVAHQKALTPQIVFEREMIVLRQVKGERFSLAQGPKYVAALRSALMKSAQRVDEMGGIDMPGENGTSRTALSLISGHHSDGSVLQAPHVALAPLGFVGHAHADGHIMGAAILCPRTLTDMERELVERTVIASMKDDQVRLYFGAAGDVTLEENVGADIVTLNPGAWSHASRVWASVTPVVLDRLPPRSKAKYDAWLDAQIRTSVERVGLPAPVSIKYSRCSFVLGAPTCHEVAPLLRRNDQVPRWHIHVEIEFSEPVCGPILIGAGRYRGYGLCRPLRDRCHREQTEVSFDSE